MAPSDRIGISRIDGRPLFAFCFHTTSFAPALETGVVVCFGTLVDCRLFMESIEKTIYAGSPAAESRLSLGRFVARK
jgi:hypothetical protein